MSVFHAVSEPPCEDAVEVLAVRMICGSSWTLSDAAAESASIWNKSMASAMVLSMTMRRA
ncbi:MAG: hypothetical protein OXN84_06825 [Albidovulum sp.]|nr:hypothetical protein [Albidovulum sp.]